MRRSFAIGGTLTRGDIETLLDTCNRLLAQHDEMVRILGDVGPAWTDARVALNRLRGPGGTNPDMARPERDEPSQPPGKHQYRSRVREWSRRKAPSLGERVVGVPSSRRSVAGALAGRASGDGRFVLWGTLSGDVERWTWSGRTGGPS